MTEFSPPAPAPAIDALPARYIWILCETGYDAAPELVRVCIDSWIIKNPTWKVVVLDRAALAQYVALAELMDGRRPDLTTQEHSVLIGVALLQQYGGVWVNATVFCSQPLDRWLGTYFETGFFAFRNPGPDRLLSTWFMAARRGNLLIETYHRRLSDLFAHTRFSFQHTLPARVAVRRLARLLNRDTHLTRYWLSWPTRRLLRAYPHYLVQYTFNRMIEDDAACRALFESGRHLQAPPCTRVQELQRQGSWAGDATAWIDSGAVPMHELDGRVDSASPDGSAVLQHLRAELASESSTASEPRGARRHQTSTPEALGRAALCITGMHRSGTSLVAAWLQRCGLPIDDGRVLGPGVGNPHGHFEDRDFYDIERASVTRQCGSWRVVSPHAMRFNTEELARARALLAARNQRFDLWGWKDPRSVLFFEQWKLIAPGLKTLVLWRPCTEVVQSLCDRAAADRKNRDFAISPYTAARVWRAHNEAALRIKRAHPRDVLLVSVEQLLAHEGAVIAHCQEAWGLNLSHAPLAEVRDQALLQARSSRLSRLAARMADAAGLERRLAARADRLT